MRERADQPITTSGYSPTVTKRVLAEVLTRLRKQSGMTSAAVAGALDWSPSKLTSIEKSTWVKPNSDDVADLCELYGVEGTQRTRLLQLTKDARQRGWWRRHTDVFPNELPGFETGAERIRTYEVQLVPGLLQSPAYIEMSMRAVGFDDASMIERHVTARAERQKILTRKERPCQLHAVVEEGALLRITDTDVRTEQHRLLLSMAKRRNVTIQLVPQERGIYPGMGEPFAHLAFPGQMYRDIVYLETLIDSRILEESDETEQYAQEFDRVCDVALSPSATSTYLRQRIE